MFEFLKSARSSKIQNRLVRYYVIFAVITVALVTCLTYTQAARSLRLTVEDKLGTVAALKVDNLNRWVNEQQSTAVFLASLPELRALAGMMLNPDSPPQERASSHEDLTSLVTLIAQRTSDFRDIQILDSNGQIVVSVSRRYIGSSQATLPFFVEGQQKTFVQDFYESDLFGNITLTVATPLFDSGNKRVGVLALHFNMKRVDDIVQVDQALNEAIRIYLIGSNRRMITNDPIVLSESPNPKSIAINAALDGGEGSAAYRNHNGMPVIGNYQWIGERNAALIVEINEEAALGPARRLAVNVALIGILFSMALVIVVTVMAGRITAPLRALTRTVARISGGDLDASAPVLSDDEVGALARAFNAMTSELRQTLAGLETELHERKQAESALRDSEQKFRTIFESSPIAICITALDDGRLLEANYAYWDMMGYNPADSIGKTSDELRLWDTSEERNVFIQNLKLKGSFYNPDDEFLDEKGDRKQAISFYRLVRIAGEERIISMFYDMSAQKQTMQALQQSETRVRALLEAVPDMIMELTLDGLVVSMIPPKGMEASMPAARFVGRQVYEVFSETAASQALFAVERSLAAGQMNVFEFEEKMGTDYRALEARVIPNSPDTVLMMLRDITQRKWVETEREKLINELEEKNKESETLRESLAGIVGTFEFSEIIQRVLDQIQQVIPYDSASVWRLEGNIQKFISGRNLPDDFDTASIEFVTDETNSALPILKGQVPFILNGDVQAELSDFQEPPHTYVNSWLAVPLRVRGNIIGLIGLDGRQKHQFNEHHAELAVTFANQMAIALENASLFANLEAELEHRRRLIEELQVMNAEAETMRKSLASIVGTFEFSEIIQRILDQIQLVVPYDSASIWRLEENRQILIGERGLPPELVDKKLEFDIDERNQALRIFSGELPYIISDDVQAESEFSRFREPPHDYIHSWLGVPLKSRGRMIGLIALDGRRRYQFNDHHAQLAVTFADQVAIALENADLFSSLQTELEERKRLIHELEGKNAESETMRESAAIVAATLEISETVRRILEQIKRVVQYDSASVWLYQDDRAVMVGSNGLPPGADAPGYYLISEREPDHGFWKDEASYIVLDDIQDRYLEFREPPINYIHGWLAVPLRARGRLTGFISLDSRTPGKFTNRDAELALTFANQVSIALENARLFSELQTELEERRKLIAELEVKNVESETLRESAAIVTATLERDETVNRILEQLERVVPFDSASVQLVEGNVLRIVSAKGFALDGPEADDTFEINEEEPACPVLTGERQYVLFDDVQERFPAFIEPPHDRIHAWLAVPLKVKGQVVGIIALDGCRVGQFTERHAQLAVTYANQVAIALENARLYSDLQSDLAIRQDLISELETKNAELERFTYTVSHDLKSPLFTIRGFLGYLEQDALAGNRERMKSDVQRITDATEKMQQLLNDLLELSRIGRLMNETVDIPFGELAREAVELVHGRIMESGVAVHIDADMPTVHGDRQRLLEVVQNLVDNAAKFMGDQPDPRIEIGWEGEEDGKPILYVRDNGMGIPPEHHERIFGLFNKLDVKVDGTGIGLALVKRIVEVHGGRIWVQSEAGKGSTFLFTLAGGGSGRQ